VEQPKVRLLHRAIDGGANLRLPDPSCKEDSAPSPRLIAVVFYGRQLHFTRERAREIDGGSRRS